MNNDDSIFEVGINFLYSFKCDLVLALIWIFFFHRGNPKWENSK